MSADLEYVYFSQVDLNDPFFASLKGDYEQFVAWFLKKKDEKAYIHHNDCGMIDGFLYCKLEYGCIEDVTPNITGNKIVKVGTFKIDSHGTRLGERFIKKIFDFALERNADKCYVTIFEKQGPLIKLLCRYGFYTWGKKCSSNGDEIVLIKDMIQSSGDIVRDYPRFSIFGNQKYLLSIYPKYHTIFFPDSKLNSETNMLEDISYTNSIHKSYVCRMSNVGLLERGDILVIYRTNDSDNSAEYKSVATSLCVVEEIKSQSSFINFEEFFNYASKYSLFDRNDLYYWYDHGGCYIIKMLYNVAFNKRITRHELICDIGLKRNEYWGLLQLTHCQFKKIIKAGGISESLIIN